MKATMVIIFMFAMILGVSNPALAWTEDFDSYAAGSGIIGQGGWDGWDGDPIWEAYVSDDQSLSSPNSLRLDATSDVVQQFSGFNSGQYQISAWQYFPSTATGYQYFILLNTYNQGGPYNWSTQIEFGDGVVFNYVDSIELPLIMDQWVEVSMIVDLDSNTQVIYYDGVLLSSTTWTDDGVLEIGALDLFSDGGTEVYWDDILVEPMVTATEHTSFSRIKTLF